MKRRQEILVPVVIDFWTFPSSLKYPLEDAGGSIAYFRPPPHHHLRTQLPSIGCVRPPGRAACRLKSRSAMWRSAARRSPQIRRLLSSSAPQAGAGAAVPGPCIVHKRGNDILHDPWYNKVGSQPIRSRGVPSSPISRLRAGSDVVSS